MPASTADPVSSVLKNAFAFNVSGRNENRAMHSLGTGLIRGGSSSSILSSNGAIDDEPSSNYEMNNKSKLHSDSISVASNSSMSSSPVLENSIRANAKKLLLSAQQCSVEFDEPTRHVSGMLSDQVSTNVPGANSIPKSKIIVLNPQQKKLQVSVLRIQYIRNQAFSIFPLITPFTKNFMK